jgi:hypothetical protein
MTHALTRSDLLRGVTLTAALLGLASPLAAQARVRYSVDEQMVAGALGKQGIAVTSAQVLLPMRITAAEPAPSLVVLRTQKARDGKVQVQMRCTEAKDCLPFLVTLDLPHADAEQLLRLSRPASPNESVVSVSADGELAPGKSAQPGSTAPVLRKGQRLVLWMDQGHIEIHIPVVALESGAPGQQVRVATADRKSLYRAFVLDADNAKGIVE